MTEQISDQWVQAVSVEAIPEEEVIGVDAVSYTHLTLPTKA